MASRKKHAPSSDESSPGEREGRSLDFSEKPSGTPSPSMLAEAIRRGWQITPERKRQYFAALDEAIRSLPDVPTATDRASIAVQCTRVLVQEQAAALKDLHKLEEYARLDDGLATARTDTHVTHTHTLDYDDLRRKLNAASGLDRRGAVADRP